MMTGGSLEPPQPTLSEDETQASKAPAGLPGQLLAGDAADGAQEGRALKMLLLGGKLSPLHPREGGMERNPLQPSPWDHLKHCFYLQTFFPGNFHQTLLSLNPSCFLSWLPALLLPSSLIPGAPGRPSPLQLYWDVVARLGHLQMKT